MGLEFLGRRKVGEQARLFSLNKFSLNNFHINVLSTFTANYSKNIEYGNYSRKRTLPHSVSYNVSKGLVFPCVEPIIK